MSSDWIQIASHIAEVTGKPFTPVENRDVAGGCINHTVVLSDGIDRWFIKLNDARKLDMFEAEAAGLDELDESNTIRVPKPLCHGLVGNRCYLVMEYIQMGSPNRESSKLAGRALAEMHKKRSNHFGWKRDNTIGSTPQPNTQSDDWIAFYREQRLGFQLELAARNGYGGRLARQGSKLMACFPGLIDHDPEASLLHGDLWGGNIAYDEEGLPLIFDPAVYYGDREADLAMTELFGGFNSDFYAAYNEIWPLDPGYTIRKKLYNLYHVLNHVNLFGGGYLSQAQSMIDRLLAEC